MINKADYLPSSKFTTVIAMFMSMTDLMMKTLWTFYSTTRTVFSVYNISLSTCRLCLMCVFHRESTKIPI